MMSAHLGTTTVKPSERGKKRDHVKSNPGTPEKRVGPTLKQCKKLTDGTQHQYIELHEGEIRGLPYSAKFRHGHLFWKLHGEECLVTIGSSYVAQVSVENIAELDDESDFVSARKILMKRLRTKKVLRDELQQQAEDLMGSIKSQLEKIGTECDTQSSSAKCLLEMMRIAEKHSYKIGFDFSKALRSNKLVYDRRLKVTFVMYAATRNVLRNRSNFQRAAKWFNDWDKRNSFLRESFSNILEQHKNKLLDSCSHSIKNSLEKLEPRRCLLIRMDDIKLFGDIECTLSGKMCSAVLPVIAANFIGRIEALKPDEFCQSLPLTNEIYFYVCKSLMEVVERVQKTFNVKDVIEYAGNQWKMASASERRAKSAVEKSLMQQLQILVDFANHFEPGKVTTRENYPHKFQVKLFEDPKSSSSKQHLWICLMDATIVNIFNGNFNRFEEYSDLLSMFHKCSISEESLCESQESFRMVTHNTLEFVAQAEQSGLACNEMNKKILEMQINCMQQSQLEGKFSFSHYRDATDVFKEYQKWCNKVLPQLPSKLPGIHFEQLVDELQNKLLDIAFQALQKKVPLEDITRFFRAHNELLIDLKDLPFEWYVRINNGTIKNALIERQEIERVQNRLKDTENECYLVRNFNKFVQVCAAEGVPQHFQMEILTAFLDHIVNLLQKYRWKRGTNMLTEKDQLSASILLINAVRSSLSYLKEQPEYLNFQKYYEESIKPFISVIEESDSLENFAKRVSQIKKSFWYIRNQRAIGINEALQLFKQDNKNFNEGLLRQSFNCYNDQFEKYMCDYGDLDDADRIDQIVKDTWGKVQPKPWSEWTIDFKRITIPSILAGLAAVWSVLVSEDVASSGNYLKPHSIQVLSILRLLSVDNYNAGVEKHLAQILTGQGKSVILGLMAAVLALLGRKVDIVCYSKYLVTRDSSDFRELFQKFSVYAQISYKTFESMAYEQIESLSEKAKRYMSKCLGIPYETKGGIQTVSDLGEEVLLIDEVDVFFMDKFYGNTCNPGFFPQVPGLGLVQQKIWEFVQNQKVDDKKTDVEETVDVESQIKAFIGASDHPDVQQLKSLMDRKNSFKLVHKDLKESEVMYTNESLFLINFRSMIETAQDIHTRSVDDEWITEFQLDPNGIITFKDELGQYRVNYYNGYNNIFIYFKLRKENFVQNVNGIDNFGYLNLHLASFSYAKIPEKYPLILGVTGTLTGLSPYEKNAIEKDYKILCSSIMPSFFGTSHLKFDRQSDFQYHFDEKSWRSAIFAKINVIVNAQRSVIVFFDNETEIASFRTEFESKLDRLNVITINTDPTTRERCVAEAGVARTVTLATSEMGRGVDYKSSLPVEKNGGVHVIQTLFLLDEKEETQIKGRTARKDNHGSYELIVCRLHLEKLKLIDATVKDDAVSYEYLDESRKRLALQVSQAKEKNLENANALHDMSISFCESI